MSDEVNPSPISMHSVCDPVPSSIYSTKLVIRFSEQTCLIPWKMTVGTGLPSLSGLGLNDHFVFSTAFYLFIELSITYSTPRCSV